MKFILTALLGFFSLSNCAPSKPHIIDIDQIMAGANSQGAKVLSQDLLGESVYRICSFGPYDELSFITNVANKNVLESLDIFPVPEGTGYFAYLDKDGKSLGYDQFPLNSGPIRWRHARKKEKSYCFQTDMIYFRIQKINNTIFIELSDI